MVIWGAICGAILFAVFSRGGNTGELFFLGAVLGALAGFTLRRAVRNEVRKALAAERALVPPPLPQAITEAAAPVTTATPAAPSEPEFVDTFPEPAPSSPEVVPGVAMARTDTSLPGEPDLFTTLAGKARDGVARFHAFAPSPFTSRRVRNNTNGRFCIRQVSKASGIVPMSSLRSTT